jgi:hypothetical protein
LRHPWASIAARILLLGVLAAHSAGCVDTEPDVARSDRTAELPRSLFVGASDASDLDLDGDGLVDDLEGALAYAFRPYLVFDSDEGARAPGEPVTIFQVRRNPIGEIRSDGTRIVGVDIKWVFLFRQDGGYGPDSDCSDDHEGDNDDALFTLKSSDDGVTWRLSRAALSSRGGDDFAGPDWPSEGTLELFDLTHPKVYMSAHKHHEYFDTGNDHEDSRYSDVFLIDDCNDDVNGEGEHFLANVHSIAIENGSFTSFSRDFNNVGEASKHGAPRFVDSLEVFFPGHSAWGAGDFYEVGSIRDKWLP